MEMNGLEVANLFVGKKIGGKKVVGIEVNERHKLYTSNVTDYFLVLEDGSKNYRITGADEGINTMYTFYYDDRWFCVYNYRSGGTSKSVFNKFFKALKNR